MYSFLPTWQRISNEMSRRATLDQLIYVVTKVTWVTKVSEQLQRMRTCPKGLQSFFRMLACFLEGG